MHYSILSTNKNEDMRRIAREFYDYFKLKVQTSQLLEIDRLRLPIKCGAKNVVIIPNPSILNLLFIISYKLLRCKVICGIHDVIGHDAEDKTKVRLYNIALTKFADAIILYSDYSELEYKRHFSKEQTTFVFTFGAAIKIIDPPETMADPFPKGRLKVLYFGRLKKYAGREKLHAISQNCKDLAFCIMGRNAPRELVGLKNVTLIDRRFTNLELEAALKFADCVIFPYESATQSGGIPLAIHAGCRIIYYDVGGLKSQICKYPAVAIEPENLIEFCAVLNNQTAKFALEGEGEKWKLCAERRNLVAIEEIIKRFG